jgi:hypothetical protein
MLPNNPASPRRVLLKTYNFMGVLLYHMRIAGISIFELFTYLRALYIKLRGEHTPKGEVGKIYLVCYSTFRKKETSCKKISSNQT